MSISQQSTIFENYVLRFSATDVCQMNCVYCDHKQGGKNHLTYDEITNILQVCFDAGIRIIHWTGGEPTARKDFIEIVNFAKSYGYKYQKMTTNGVTLLDLAAELRKAGIDRVNVSLDSLSEDKYFKITRSNKLKTVIAGIQKATQVFDMIKINVCVTDQNIFEIHDFIVFASSYYKKIFLKFLELVPCDNLYEQDPQQFLNSFVSIETIKSIIEKTYEIEPIDIGNYTRTKCKYFYIRENGVTFGLNPNSSINYACQKSSCMDIRLNPAGYISDCSTNLKNMIYLPELSTEQMQIKIKELLHLKNSRGDNEWKSYRHKQKYYGFWRFGEKHREDS